MGSKGSQQVTTNQAQTYSPDPNAYAAISGALGRANQVSQTPFGIPTAPVAGFSGQQQQAFDITGNAQGVAQPYINQAANYFSPQGAQAFANPYINNVTANLQDIFGQQMSQATGQAVQQAGGQNADRVAVAQAQLGKQQGLTAGQTYANLYNSAAQQAQTAAFGTANLGSAAQNAQLQGANALLGTGGLQQQLQQAQLNAPYQNILQSIAWPYQNAQFLAGVTGSLAPGLGGTTAGQGNTGYPGASPWGTAAGLGLAGVGAYGIGQKQGWWGGGGGKGGNTNAATGFAGDGSGGGAGDYVAARGGRIYAAGGGVQDEGDATFGLSGGSAVDPQLRMMQEHQLQASGMDAPGAQQIRLPNGMSGIPMNMTPQAIVPQTQTPQIQPRMPQLNLNPPQGGGGGSGGGGGKGVDMGTLLKTGMSVAAMFGRGGHVGRFADGGASDDDTLSFSDRAQPTQDAIASGAFDPVGENYTAFDPRAPRSPFAAMPPTSNGGGNGMTAMAFAPTGGQATPAPQPDADAPPPSPASGARASNSSPYTPPDLIAAAGDSKAPTDTSRPSQHGMSEMLTNPYGLALLSGLSIMGAAGQRDAHGLPMSPFAAIGQGGLAGIKQEQSIEDASKRLDQAAKQHLDEYTKLKPNQRADLAYKQEELRLKGRDQSYKQELLSAGLISQDSLEDMALSYRRGNTGIIQGLGRGTQGPVNISRFWNTLEQQLKAEGATGADLAAAKANFTSQTAAMKSQAVRSANIDSAIEEVDNMLPILDRTAKALDQSKFVPWNKLVQLVQGNISDPRLAEFTGSLRALQSAYAVALNRGANVPTVHAMQASEEMLKGVTSYESLQATIKIMKQEMEAARNAPETVARKIEERIRRGGAGGASAPQAPAAPQAVEDKPKVGDRKQFKQGVGVWNGTTYVPESP